MTSSHVLENLIAGTLIQDSSRGESDLSDVIRVVQQLNAANAVLGKMDFQTRGSMTLTAISQFRHLLNIELQKGLEALDDADSFLSQYVRSSGAPASRLLSESFPSALQLLDKIENIVKSDLEDHGVFFPSTGPVALFLGWADPLVSFIRKVPLLFAAGNGICIKASTSSAGAIMAVAKVWNSALEKSGVPVGMFSVLSGRGAGEETVGDLLLKHPSFKSIYWIGRSDSALAARTVALEAGKRFYFFGSGRNPAILFAPLAGTEGETALEKTLDGIVNLALDPHGWGPYRPSRLFIQEVVYKKSLEYLEARLRAVKVGDPRQSVTELGWLPPRAIERFQAQLKLALSETGKLVTGGERIDHRLVQPTLVRDLTNCSTLQGEELEGVFLTAASFKYQHEAVKFANTSPLGLLGFVIHPDLEKAKGLASKLEVSRLLLTMGFDRAELLAREARPVKNSASHNDGLAVTFEQGRYRPTVFVS